MIKTDSTKIPEFNINGKNTTCEVSTVIKDIIKSNTIALQKLNKEDRVQHPSHYTWLKELCGIEVIDITRHMNFNLGQILKYILRLGHKEDKNFTHYEKVLSDLNKAKYYLESEIDRVNKLCKKNGNH